MESNTIKALLCLQDLALRLKDETAILAVATIHDSLKDKDEWKQIAAYFGDCAAASAEQLTKSSPANAKRRHQSICLSFAEMLKTGRLDRPYRNYNVDSLAVSIERLLNTAKRIEDLQK